MQRAKHADEIHKAQKEHLENEKRHWRTVAMAQEETAWERSLRAEAHGLLEFVELERHFEAAAAEKTLLSRPVVSVKALSPGPEADISFQTARESEAVVFDDDDDDGEAAAPDVEMEEPAPDVVAVSRAAHKRTVSTKSIYDEARAMEAAIDATTITSESTTGSRCLQTPRQRPQAMKIPVHFNDGPSSIDTPESREEAEAEGEGEGEGGGEDKENQTPQKQPSQTMQEVLKTPMTMDRAAALAAIEYRRGRAKSFMNAQTPKKMDMGAGGGERRDVSAPPLITMSVGRRK